MLYSNNPHGYRARQHRLLVTVGWYLLGSVMGGVAIGSVSGLIGSTLPSGTWRAFAVIAVCVVGAGLDVVGRQPPSIHRQVDENWLAKYRGWVYGWGFGFQLGLGVVTIVTTASVYTTIALAMLSGSVVFGAVIGGIFGLARAAAIFLVASAGDPSALRRALRQLQDGLPAARLLVVGAQTAAALSAVLFIIR